MFVELPPAVQARLRERGWRFYTFLGETGCRLMCAWDTTPETVDRFAADMRPQPSLTWQRHRSNFCGRAARGKARAEQSAAASLAQRTLKLLLRYPLARKEPPDSNP